MAAAARSAEAGDVGVLEQRQDDLERRVTELEQALRRDGGIYDTLRKLEVRLETFVSEVTASVRIASAVGSAVGAIIGAIFAAGVAVLLSLMKG
jgi:hypothetical protein